MSLRSAILTHAVPILGRTSFTRAALTGALASLPPTHPDYKGPAPLDESVVDTLFGAGPTAGPRALVDAFAQAGLDTMNKGPTTLQEVLSRRLEHSAALGEHIVEAYALMATPSSPSLPLPPLVLELLRARLPSVPIYAPGPGPVTAAAWRAGSSAASSVLERTGGRLPLPTLDAAASLRYAWDIADAAVYAARPNKGVGVMREPRGAGVEWYTTRVGLTIAYLQAGESRHGPPAGGVVADCGVCLVHY